jgi:hypothetical protein
MKVPEQQQDSSACHLKSAEQLTRWRVLCKLQQLFFFFFNCIQQKNTQDQSTITNRPWKNYYKALECKAKKLEWHG